MICISIQPFAKRKLVALALAALCLSTASCFADALYLSSARPEQQRQAIVARSMSLPQKAAAPARNRPLQIVRTTDSLTYTASQFSWLDWQADGAGDQDPMPPLLPAM